MMLSLILGRHLMWLMHLNKLIHIPPPSSELYDLAIAVFMIILFKHCIKDQIYQLTKREEQVMIRHTFFPFEGGNHGATVLGYAVH